ncbi:hypothetical protein EPI10_002158 [Gossypium australe]|uniref:Uncharacterized protein n=1 Tax=Gossypium australe TaxID=47621 RepID=A0A5B6VDQ7_9ROSI|nr:hypothetical protein EPI10_002158 [Gossypium australe]
MFCRRMTRYVNNDQLLIHCFQDSLIRSAAKWYNQLSCAQVNSWKDLAQAFMKQYSHVMDMTPDRLILQNIKKKQNESFRQYAQRWREVATQVQPPLLEKETTIFFINTLKATFINHMLGSATKSFSDIIMSGEIIENAVKSGKIDAGESSKRSAPRKKESEINNVSTYNKGYSKPITVGPPKTITTNFQSPPRQESNQKLNTEKLQFTHIPMTYKELYQSLFDAHIVSPFYLKPMQPSYPKWYDANAQCKYHECNEFGALVQGLMDNKELEFFEYVEEAEVCTSEGGSTKRNYGCNVTIPGEESPISASEEGRDVGFYTRTGKHYDPSNTGAEPVKRKTTMAEQKREKTVGSKSPVNELVTENEAREFLKFLKHSEYSVEEQLHKQPARISVLALLLSSEVHREALMKVLNETYVANDVSVNKLDSLVNNISVDNFIFFNDDEIPLGGMGSTKALHISTRCKGYTLPGVLIDNESALNVLPLSTLNRLPMDSSHMKTTGAVPTSLHQKLKLVADGRLVTINVVEDIIASVTSDAPYVGTDDEALECSFRSLKFVNATFIVEGNKIQVPKISKTTRMGLQLTVGKGALPGRGLGKCLQGKVEAPMLKDKHDHNSLGFKPDARQRKNEIEKKQERRRAKLSGGEVKSPNINNMSDITTDSESPFEQDLCMKDSQDLEDDRDYNLSPDLLRMIGAYIAAETRQDLIELLQEFKDVIAWSYQDMPGLSTDIVVHRLPIKEECKPVQQKLRTMRSDVLLKIKEEVRKQFDAGFLQVVKYSEWVANIVSVPKKDGNEIEVYIDNMIAKSRTEKEHIQVLRKLFLRLRKFQLNLNPTKCTFGARLGKLLGFVVSEKGIEIDPDKVKAIQELSSPRTQKEVRGFLGRLNYIARFISQLTEKCDPIFRLLKKHNPGVWDEECQRTFDKVKHYLSNALVLMSPNPYRPLILYFAVFGNSMGCVLGQHDES